MSIPRALVRGLWYILYAFTLLRCVDKPKWNHRKSVRKFGGALGQRAQLSCVVYSLPARQSFYWLDKSATNISLSSSYSVVSGPGNTSVLTIASVTQADYGQFTCVASNAVGISRFTLTLMPPGKILCVRFIG